MNEKMYRLNTHGSQLLDPSDTRQVVVPSMLRQMIDAQKYGHQADSAQLSLVEYDEDDNGTLTETPIIIGTALNRGDEIGHDGHGPITLDYVMGDAVRIKTNTNWSGAPHVGEEFYTEQTGTVVAIYLHEFDDDNYNPMYAIKTADGRIRQRRNNEILGLA